MNRCGICLLLILLKYSIIPWLYWLLSSSRFWISGLGPLVFLSQRLSNILSLSVPDEGYYRNVSCTLNLISTFLWTKWKCLGEKQQILVFGFNPRSTTLKESTLTIIKQKQSVLLKVNLIKIKCLWNLWVFFSKIRKIFTVILWFLFFLLFHQICFRYAMQTMWLKSYLIYSTSLTYDTTWFNI
jgi:hypothetical protein